MSTATTTHTAKSIHTGNCEKCGAWTTDLYRPTTISRRTGREIFTGGFTCPVCK